MAVDNCESTLVYLGLGGNAGHTLSLLHKTLEHLDRLPAINQLEVSRLYHTSPVGNPNQPFFINAVCRFYTTLSLKELLAATQLIEQLLGKVPKPKDAPRPIDIDILFYGSIFYSDSELEIPHPAWQQRLFVLVPLLDLTQTVTLQSPQKTQQLCISSLIHALTQNTSQIIQALI